MHAIKTRIRLKGLLLACHVGVPKPERKAPQTIRVDIVCALADPAVEADHMNASVDYGHIRRLVKEVADTRTFLLLEKMAEAMAEVILADTRIESVVISCAKPFKFSDCAEVGIERTFKR